MLSPWNANNHSFLVEHASCLALHLFDEMPDRLSSRAFLAMALPHSPSPQLVVALCCQPSSCAFSCRCRRLPLNTLAVMDREVVDQPLPYFRSLFPRNACRLAALYLAFPTLPHLLSVLAGQQVTGRCAGPGTLVPARHEHVVNMGRCGHTRVSDLVAG
jgi:hypothetical protein